MNISLPDYIWLRKGRPRTVTVAGRAPRVGRAYVAVPPRESGKPRMHVTVLAVEALDDGWSVAVTAGDTVDHPRLLRARPGAGGDYTTEPRLAADGEPEAVPAGYQAGISAEASDRDHELRAERVKKARALIEEGASLLDGAGHHARRAARDIRHYADRVALHDTPSHDSPSGEVR